MGYKTVVLDPAADAPAAAVCDVFIQAAVDDKESALKLAAQSDVVTLEWELIPAETLKAIESKKPLFPSSKVIEAIQDRLTQKEFLQSRGLPLAPFAAVDTQTSLAAGVRRLGPDCILKRRRAGYDGKGQQVITADTDLSVAENLLSAPCVLERKVSFKKELSVILSRDGNGTVTFFPLAENIHRKGILHATVAPARISSEVRKKAEDLAAAAASALGHVGVLAAELFLLPGGALLINEIAPRVHNSGHYTLGACATSQFEAHLRAVCGLPAGAPALLAPAVMVNLMGELWESGEPDWTKVLACPQARLHLYGKKKASPGRKMGHIVLVGVDAEAGLALADELLRQ